MKRFLLLIISLMMLTLPVAADGYVADNAAVISEATEAQIKRTNDALADKNGASIHIYTAESCDGDIEDFARGLFNSYGLDGRAVLLCVFKDAVGKSVYFLLAGGSVLKNPRGAVQINFRCNFLYAL